MTTLEQIAYLELPNIIKKKQLKWPRNKGQRKTLHNKILRAADSFELIYRKAVDKWFKIIDTQAKGALGRIKKEEWDEYEDDIDWEFLTIEGLLIFELLNTRLYEEGAKTAARFAGTRTTGKFPVFDTWAKRDAGRLVTNVSNGVRENIKNAAIAAREHGITIENMVRRIRPGLPVLPASFNRIQRQYFEKLADGMTTSMADRWRTRELTKMRNYRATLISRTEAANTMVNSNLIWYGQTGIARVMWSVSPGACPLCDPHNGEIYNVYEAIGLIPLHPNGMCTWIPLAPGEV